MTGERVFTAIASLVAVAYIVGVPIAWVKRARRLRSMSTHFVIDDVDTDEARRRLLELLHQRRYEVEVDRVDQVTARHNLEGSVLFPGAFSVICNFTETPSGTALDLRSWVSTMNAFPNLRPGIGMYLEGDIDRELEEIRSRLVSPGNS